jgi:hypothetical protein
MSVSRAGVEGELDDSLELSEDGDRDKVPH